jgi:hypothetical protein
MLHLHERFTPMIIHQSFGFLLEQARTLLFQLARLQTNCPTVLHYRANS